MKTILTFILSAILFTSCIKLQLGNNYPSHFYDEYKQKQTAVLKQLFYPLENNSSIQNAEFEMLLQSDSLLKLFININRNFNSQPVENKIYIKINNDKIYQATLQLIDAKKHDENIIETNTTFTTDTSGVVSHHVTTSNNNVKWNADNYTVVLPGKVLEDLKSCYSLNFRLYAGAIPSTFKLNNHTIQQLNCFLNK